MIITAEEARRMHQPSIDDALEKANRAIIEAAKTKRHVYLHGDFWANEGYNNSPRYRAAVKKLEELGYQVRFHYEDRQFVDMYTIVEW